MTVNALSVELASGQKLGGRYIVDGVMAKGGMSTVYAATDVRFSRSVAVKVMSELMLAEPEGLARFRHEARASAQLRTPRVPQIYDIGVLPEGNPYLVMERLDGKDLAQTLMEKKALPIELAVDMILQTCDALAEVHARGMVHRDLKPANLFVTTALDGSPFVKVLDFGISKFLESKRKDAALTRPGHAVGTPEYMAPERLEVGATLDPRADIWSLGVILHEIVTGNSLFAGSNIAVTAMNIRTRDIPRLSTQRPEATNDLDLVLLKCLARNREARYADVGTLAAALAPFGPPRSDALAEQIARTMERARGVPFLENASELDPPEASQRDIASEAVPSRRPVAACLPTIDAEPLTRGVVGKSAPSEWSRRRYAAIALVLSAIALLLFALSRGRAPAPLVRTTGGAGSSTGEGAPVKVSAAASDDSDDDDPEYGVEEVNGSPGTSATPAPSAASSSPAPVARAATRPRARAGPPHGVRLALERPLAAGTTLLCDGAELVIGPKRPARVAAGPHLVKALASGRTVWASKINGQEGQLVVLRIPDEYAAP